MSNVVMQYEFLLHMQLESQRKYFEDLLAKAQTERDALRNGTLQMKKRKHKTPSFLTATLAEVQLLAQQRALAAEEAAAKTKALKSLEKRHAALEASQKKLIDETAFEKEVQK